MIGSSFLLAEFILNALAFFLSLFLPIGLGILVPYWFSVTFFENWNELSIEKRDGLASGYWKTFRSI